jgi:hypothetical protein
MAKIEFIDYDGEYPCLCFGTLKIKVDGKEYNLEHVMISGGAVYATEDYSDMWAEQDDWKLNLSSYPELEPYKEEITKLVNDNVEKGCCGGCI